MSSGEQVNGSACGDPSAGPAQATTEAIGQIDRSLERADSDTLHEAEARLRELGDTGFKMACSHLVELFSPGNQLRRQYWIGFCVDWRRALPLEVYGMLDKVQLTYYDWVNIVHTLPGHHETWAVDLALRLRQHEASSIRLQAVEALLECCEARVRKALLESIQSDPSPSVRWGGGEDRTQSVLRRDA